MALTDPINLLIIGVLFTVIVVWGPQRLPEIVRRINALRAEYNKVSSNVLSQIEGLSQPLPSSDKEFRQMKSNAAIIESAKKLGIVTEGKTKDEIIQEILSAIERNRSASEAATTEPSNPAPSSSSSSTSQQPSSSPHSTDQAEKDR